MEKGAAPVFSLEPARTNYDLHFRAFGIPVRISPWFWLAAFILGYLSAGASQPIAVLIFMAVMFVSILVHELGHALLMRKFGYDPHIVLYHFGGLAIREQRRYPGGFSGDFAPRSRRNESRESILISLAGPAAGFLLAAATVMLVFAAQGRVEFVFRFPDFWAVDLREETPAAIYYLVSFLLFINIFWGLMNLLPIFPLDGGQVARELLSTRDPHTGLVQTLQLSIGVAIVVALFLFFSPGSDNFGAMMFGGLAISNYLMLQQVGRLRW